MIKLARQQGREQTDNMHWCPGVQRAGVSEDSGEVEFGCSMACEEEEQKLGLAAGSPSVV